jgi:hypothetical protein
MKVWLVALLILEQACKQGASSGAADKPTGTTVAAGRTGAPYAGFGYDSLHRAPPEAFKPLGALFRPCTSQPIDTLKYDILWVVMKGDSIRGFIQDSIEGNAEAPQYFRRLRFDSVARVLQFEVATASRSLSEYQMSVSCDRLVGSVVRKTALHAQDELSGVEARQATYERARVGKAARQP